MFDRNHYAARLLQEGFRVVSLPSVVCGATDYMLYGCGITVATCDSDFAIKMERLPRQIAADFESWLRGRG